MKRMILTVVALALALIALSGHAPAHCSSIEKDFASPPASARPWVYWFWLNGNITPEGITADLEAMQRVGIGGALIMEVDVGSPVGPIPFMGDRWRELFKHVVAEATRLGLEINMNNDAGWNGSGGPWIKPEQSMQRIVWTETEVTGPKQFSEVIKTPETTAGYYRDVKLLAFPTPGAYRIPGIRSKALYQLDPIPAASPEQPSAEMIVDQSRVIDLTGRMDASGKLTWEAPAGNWTLMRFGHTSTGAGNAPAPATGGGLECDKLSKEGSTAAFNGLLAKLVADSKDNVGKGFVAGHVDSWENGAQNWTARMPEEFLRRRGYDPLPFLPVMSGRVVGSPEVSERFLWDLRRTVSELVVENYAGNLRDLAHAAGLRFTIEAYGGPCDAMPYGGMADEPMGEFWVGGYVMDASSKGMTSSGHIYGKKIIGAEAFTSWDTERWREHPGTIKTLADKAFCEGINRLVVHRYAMQPWKEGVRPGMMMGPYGLHYERTQTWWEQSRKWHEYLARCQYLLRQGLFVADICYLQPQAPPFAYASHPRLGYDWDECDAETVMNRMTVKNGRITLPDGMSYRVLVLPQTRLMTPELLRKIGDLVRAGATVIGAPPTNSPSLQNYPACDQEVQMLAASLWGNCDGVVIKERKYGKGRVICGISPEKALAKLGVKPDFSAQEQLRSIHRALPDADIYFVSNPEPRPKASACQFRVSGKTPELWWPETGRIERAPVYKQKNGVTSVALQLEQAASVFVVFRNKTGRGSPIVSITRDGDTLLDAGATTGPGIEIRSAVYGVPGDPVRTRNVRAKLQGLLDAGDNNFYVTRMAEGDDPADKVVKTLTVTYISHGKRLTAQGLDTDYIHNVNGTLKMTPSAVLDDPAKAFGFAVGVEPASSDGAVKFTAWVPGRYSAVRANGSKVEKLISALPKAIEPKLPWTLSFPAGNGAPAEVTLGRLQSWSEHPDSGVKYFSGTAVYRTTLEIPASLLTPGNTLRLNLGSVREIAQITLNGKDLGTLWKPPYVVAVGNAVRQGTNVLEVKVTNLWPNRMIGDEQLPEDSDRNPDGTLKSWPKWLDEGKPSPTGRITFAMWRLWKKDDALLESGLIGPVRIEAGREVVVK